MICIFNKDFPEEIKSVFAGRTLSRDTLEKKLNNWENEELNITIIGETKSGVVHFQLT